MQRLHDATEHGVDDDCRACLDAVRDGRIDEARDEDATGGITARQGPKQGVSSRATRRVITHRTKNGIKQAATRRARGAEQRSHPSETTECRSRGATPLLATSRRKCSRSCRTLRSRSVGTRPRQVSLRTKPDHYPSEKRVAKSGRSSLLYIHDIAHRTTAQTGSTGSDNLDPRDASCVPVFCTDR